jgi:hypothetical protein
MDEQAKINKDTITKFKAIDKVLENIDSKVTQVGSSNHQVLNMMKMLETQVGQLAGRLTTNEGKLPEQPKGPETAKAIQTRSGKETEDAERPREQGSLNHPSRWRNLLRRKLRRLSLKNPSLRCREKTRRYCNSSHATSEVNFIITLRSLWRLCVDLASTCRYWMPFKFLHILVTYILANKYEIATLGVDHVKMSEQCSASIANGLEKQKDPGCPTIPCSVGSFKFEKALCHLGESVSVMPRDVLEKLCLPLEPTGMCLELGHNSIRYPLGMAEHVPVKVGHHFIPVDFVVLEMGEREKPPLILERPFLKTVGATIDVGKGEINFDINGEKSSFKFRPCLEVCNMIEAKYVPPHRHIVKEEPREKEGLKKKKEPKKKDVKKIKKDVASVKTKEQKLPVKTKKITKPGNKPVPKMVRKWVPKIATPAKSVYPK